MELDITRFFTIEEPSTYSASAAELGADAGRITWQNAMQNAATTEAPLLVTEDQFQAFRDHAREFGAWDDAEIAGWCAVTCNALLSQMIAGDMRDAGIGGQHDG